MAGARAGAMVGKQAAQIATRRKIKVTKMARQAATNLVLVTLGPALFFLFLMFFAVLTMVIVFLNLTEL